MGFKLGSTVGKVEEVDTDVDGTGWGEYLLVRVHISLTKPLPRGRTLKLKDKLLGVPFQYEKIPKFCFNCGVISHGREGCSKVDGNSKSEGSPEFEYGPWLRVSKSRPWLEKRRSRQREWNEEHGAGVSREDLRSPAPKETRKDVINEVSKRNVNVSENHGTPACTRYEKEKEFPFRAMNPLRDVGDNVVSSYMGAKLGSHKGKEKNTEVLEKERARRVYNSKEPSPARKAASSSHAPDERCEKRRPTWKLIKIGKPLYGGTLMKVILLCKASSSLRELAI